MEFVPYLQYIMALVVVLGLIAILTVAARKFGMVPKADKHQSAARRSRQNLPERVSAVQRAVACVVVPANSRDTGSPVENLKTDAPAELSKFPAAFVEILAAYTEPVAITGIALINHNLPSGASVILHYSDDLEVWGSITLSWKQALLWQEIDITGMYFKIAISVISGTIEIGQVYLGTFAPFPTSPVYPITKLDTIIHLSRVRVTLTPMTSFAY